MLEETKTVETKSPDKNPTGRPAGCTPEVIKSAQYYLENWKKLDPEDVIPTMEGLALYLEVSRRAIYNFRDANEIFMHILEKIMQAQAKALIANGLLGKYNSTITKLILTKHDYHDKQDNTLANPDGSELKVNVVNFTSKE